MLSVREPADECVWLSPLTAYKGFKTASATHNIVDQWELSISFGRNTPGGATSDLSPVTLLIY